MVTDQVLDLSFCLPQFGSPFWADTVDTAQLALGVLMCLLVVIQFIRQSLQMYNATKQVHLSRYINLLVREGMFYFLVYVHELSLHFLHATKLTTNCLQ